MTCPNCHDGRTWRIDLPISKPLNLNHRQHWAPKSIEVATVRTAACVMAKRAKIPKLARFTVVLHYAPATRSLFDRDNLGPTVKATVDGIVDAGVCDGDDYTRYHLADPVIHPPTHSEGRLWAIIRELPEAA